MRAWLITHVHLVISIGFHLSEELKEHFSAWRRLLVAALAPELLSLIALIFMPEGPLNLMQNGRDAESLSVYKVIYYYTLIDGQYLKI